VNMSPTYFVRLSLYASLNYNSSLLDSLCVICMSFLPVNPIVSTKLTAKIDPRAYFQCDG
jgi:hypothetical protein